MKNHTHLWRIEEMAKILEVSSSGYYRFLKFKPSQRANENEELFTQIKEIYEVHKKRYGSPRIHKALVKKGIHCSRKRVSRLMSQNQLIAKPQKRFKLTTTVDKKAAFAPNLLDQKFEAKSPNQKWVSDITYIWTLEGWLYLAVILDLFSRKVVGVSMSNSLQSEIVTDALQQAVCRRNPPQGLIHHSDRGVQYTSTDFQKRLKENQIICSMSATGNCYDNAVAESFFNSLKTECVYTNSYVTRDQARQSIFEYIEVYYNNDRLHSTIGYLTPNEFENNYFSQQQNVSLRGV
jgi:transposase InsO family protein